MLTRRNLLLLLFVKALSIATCTAQAAAPSSDWAAVQFLPPGTQLIVNAPHPLRCELGDADSGGILCERTFRTSFGPVDRSFAIDRSVIRSVALQRTARQAALRDDDVKFGAESGAAFGFFSGLLFTGTDGNGGRGVFAGTLAGLVAGVVLAEVAHARHTPKPVTLYVAPVLTGAPNNASTTTPGVSVP